jgi:hypothetical protein
MERSLHISPFICMSTKIVSLSLDQISRQSSPSVTVKISKTGGHTRGANTGVDSKAYNSSPGRLSLNDFLRKLWIHKKVCKIRVPIICLLNSIQEYSSDDAAPLPDPSQFSQLQVPSLSIQLHGSDSSPVHNYISWMHKELASHH